MPLVMKERNLRGLFLKREASMKRNIAITFILAVVLFTGIHTAHADPSDPQRPSKFHCDEDRPTPQVIGTKEDLQTLALKICSDLNTEEGDSISCQNKIEECKTSTADYLWAKVQRDEACETRLDHYYCSACGLERIQYEIALLSKATYGAATANACRCGNGRLDSGEACDPSLPSDPNSHFQCSAFCSLIVVDPNPNTLNSSGLGGSGTDSGTRVVNDEPRENPAVSGNVSAAGCSFSGGRTPVPHSLSFLISALPFLALVTLRQRKKGKA